MGSENPDLGSGRPDLGSERPDLESGRPDLRSEKPDLGSERSDLELKRPDLGSERLYLRLGGGGDGRTDGRKPEKIALCGIIGHRPLRGRCPKALKTDEPTFVRILPLMHSLSKRLKTSCHVCARWLLSFEKKEK